MSGQRISGRAFTPAAGSPPFGAFEGTDGDGDANLYRSFTATDTAGLATEISSFDDGGTTSEGVRNAVISPNGAKILFEVDNPSSGLTEIWVVANAAGSSATQVVADASKSVVCPSWGDDSDAFVYVRGDPSGGAIEKDVVSAAGSPTVLKSSSGGFSPHRPLFSPDGTKILYVWDKDIGSGGDLRVMDADGSNDASLDNTITGYRADGPQHGWSNDSSLIVYEDGATSGNKVYVIAPDRTGKTQVNASGDASGFVARVSDRAFPSDDSYVVFTANLGNGYFDVIRGELDGSDTNIILAGHGAWNANYFRHALVADSRVWFIESASVLGSFAVGGTDYRTDLTIDGSAMKAFADGDGWFYN